jgi:hypothetical protein
MKLAAADDAVHLGGRRPGIAFPHLPYELADPQ